MARKKNPDTSILKIAAGVAVGALATYAIVKSTESKAKEKTAKAPAIPEEPPGPGPDVEFPSGPGVNFPAGPSGPSFDEGEAGHRLPLPMIELPMPETAADMLALDRVLCEATDGVVMENTASIAQLALEQGMPQIPWPSVPGDHPSIIALDYIMRFRAAQIGLMDPNLTVEENFTNYCATLPLIAHPLDIGG